MQIRCTHCTRTIAIAPDGALPASCPHCAAAAVPAALGDYRLDRLLAAGGMGEVYVAHHAELGTPVAVKLLPAMPLDAIPALRERFAREARLTAKVRHPGVVRVLHSDASGDRPYLVLELVDGETLRSLLANGPPPVVEGARLVATLADVLAAAHAEGVLHRDVKPDNVMVTSSGDVRVLDFGIARAMHDDAPLTRTGELIGTPEYMAPEQLLEGPEATDARTDVHALGVLLYELLTGRSPFRSANVFQALKLVESLVPPPPSSLRPEVPEALDAVVLRALEKRAEDRFPTAATMAAAIRTAVPAAASAAPATAHGAPPRARWIALAVVLFGLAMPVVAWQVAARRDDPGPAAPPEVSSTASDGIPVPGVPRGEALAQGSWSSALTSALRDLDEGDAAALADARDAFVLSHVAWLRAAGLPPWLGATDRPLARRLFGDPHEPSATRAELHDALLRGDDDAWHAWLADPRTPESARRLLATTALPIDDRAAALADFARRVAIGQPEHWLARVVERHLRQDLPGAEQAAEMAWLSGAGETAVLLDAALASRVDAPEATAAAAPRALARWRRVAGADPGDCPANTLLLLWLEVRHGIGDDFDPTPARAFPAGAGGDPAAWFVAAAQAGPPRSRCSLLRVAVALGGAPDFAAPPWRDLSEQERSLVDAEARRDR